MSGAGDAVIPQQLTAASIAQALALSNRSTLSTNRSSALRSFSSCSAA